MNLNSDQTKFHLHRDYGFSFGVLLTDYNGTIFDIDPTFFNLTIQIVEYRVK